jgi:uncharacterized membrane protein
MEELLRWLGFGLCHQLPERSFAAGGVQLPVCARDTGIYLGFALSLALIVYLSRGRRPAEMPPIWLMVLGIGFVGLMGVDGVTSYAGLRETTNAIRLATGLLTGYALPLALVPILNGQLWRRPGPDRVLGGPRNALAWLASIPVVFAVAYWGLPYAGVAYPILVGLAIVLTFSAVNLAIVCLFPPFERRLDRLADAWLPLVLAVGMTLGELWATGLLRSLLERAAGIA